MIFNENIDLKGEVIITSIDALGNTKILVEDKNLIVLNGRRSLAKSLIGISNTYIDDVVFGTGGVLLGNPNAIIPILPTDTNVNNPLSVIKNVDYIFVSPTVTDIDSNLILPPKLTFNITIPTVSNLNGLSLNEMALLLNTSPSSTAFAIKRFSTIVKSTSISINIKWVIYL